VVSLANLTAVLPSCNNQTFSEKTHFTNIKANVLCGTKEPRRLNADAVHTNKDDAPHHRSYLIEQSAIRTGLDQESCVGYPSLVTSKMPEIFHSIFVFLLSPLPQLSKNMNEAG